MAEVIDINLDGNDLEEIRLNNDSSNDIGESKASSNFGPGIELLMNEKKRDGSATPTGSEINIDDLENLENELNDLSDKQSRSDAEKNMFASMPGISLNSDNNDMGGFDSGP